MRESRLTIAGKFVACLSTGDGTIELGVLGCATEHEAETGYELSPEQANLLGKMLQFFAEESERINAPVVKVEPTRSVDSGVVAGAPDLVFGNRGGRRD